MSDPSTPDSRAADALQHILAAATADKQARDAELARYKPWGREYVRDIHEFDAALHQMYDAEFTASDRFVPGVGDLNSARMRARTWQGLEEFDPSDWLPGLLTAARLIGKRGWSPLLQGRAECTTSKAERAMLYILLTATGGAAESDLRERLADFRSSGLLKQFTWQYLLNGLTQDVRGCYSSERSHLFPLHFPPPSRPPEPVPAGPADPGSSAAESGEGKKPAAICPPGKRKNIDARMLKTLVENPAAAGWTVRQWASKLGCGESTIAETPTWTNKLAAARALAKAEAIERRRSGKKKSK